MNCGQNIHFPSADRDTYVERGFKDGGKCTSHLLPMLCLFRWCGELKFVSRSSRHVLGHTVYCVSVLRFMSRVETCCYEPPQQPFAHCTGHVGLCMVLMS
ncbi:hypothetical protein RvY_05644 [Ramazzottius varieornatus]|uniref:Uncharacterized protein n=1 Tax=Ramazzottius varieornatus TaxID=947166 RepID=A0A1D1V4R8_RAMVA|nr:hypothetical protein RvY_05644 [Ramazzottius varieornatus]